VCFSKPILKYSDIYISNLSVWPELTNWTAAFVVELYENAFYQSKVEGRCPPHTVSLFFFPIILLDVSLSPLFSPPRTPSALWRWWTQQTAAGNMPLPLDDYQNIHEDASSYFSAQRPRLDGRFGGVAGRKTGASKSSHKAHYSVSS
jgi:hypothetical protein